MPGTKLKALHMATSVEQLKSIAEVTGINNYSINNLCKSAGSMFEEAEKCRLDGDEERSFIFYMKYWALIQRVRKLSEYTQDKKYYDGMLGRQSAKDALGHIEKLQESLTRRYTIWEEEKIRKKQEEEEEEEMISNSLQEIKLEKDSTKSKKTILTEDLTAAVNDRTGVITSQQLFKSMKDEDKIMIIDVRSKTDYDDSHIQYSTCFNIDESIITPGITGKSLEKKLSSENLKFWNEREKVDLIILYNWTGEDIDQKLSILHKSMTTWDVRVKLKCQPRFLAGGFEMWQLHYPMYTSKRMLVAIPKYTAKQNEGIINLNDLVYPDFDENNFKEVNAAAQQPIFDRAAKPDNFVKFSSNLDIKNLEPSLMTNGSSHTGTPQVNRSLKPKEFDSLTSESSDEMKAILAKRNRAATESLSIEKERFDREQKLKFLQLSREKEHVESMHLVLQQREDELLEQIQTLELEKEQKELEEQKMKEENEKSKKIIILMAQQRHADLKKFEEQEGMIEKKIKDRVKLEHEVAILRQERKKKEQEQANQNEIKKTEQEQAKLNEIKKSDASDSSTRSESPKVDAKKTKPDLKITHPGGDTYFTKLSDHQVDKSNHSLQINKPNLSRSHSSPNIAQMIPSDEEPQSRNHTPHIDRTIKPFTKTERKTPTIAPEDYNAARMRNLMPVYGNQGRALTGLKNLGNTCFMNSVIQCLAQTTTLANYFIQGLYMKDINRKNPLGHGGELAEEFAVVIRALLAGQYRSITPRDFKNTVSKYQPIFEGNEQQDSQEFLLFLMDGLHEDLNEARVHNKPKKLELCENENLPDTKAAKHAWDVHLQHNQSVIVKLFQGQLKSTVKCLHCNKQSVSFDPLQFLSLPIPTGNSSRYNLEDCLQVYLKEENMTGADKWFCPKCKERRDAVKKCDIWKLPPVLLIHLKRFSYDGMWRRKLQTLVDFPLENLDFNVYVKDPNARYTSYSLYAVSNHYGTMEGGHYTAYCKNSEYQKWYKFDDHEVNEISSDVVKSSAAYILFYRAVNE